MTRRRSDAGQAVLFVALGMVVLLGFLGLGIDMGYMRYMKRRVQMVADAAAIAGATEIPNCTSPNCAALQTAAETAVSTDNSFPSVSENTGCSPAPGLGATVVLVNNPPTCLGASDPHNGDNGYVETLVAANVPTLFAKVFGQNSAVIKARAEAISTGSNCVYVLDQSGFGALTNIVGIYASNCGVVVESNNSDAFFCLGLSFGAPYIGVVGGAVPLCIFGGASPTTGITDPNPTDPLAYRQASMEAAAPAPGSCGTSTSSPYTGHNGQLNISSAATLNSGTYCGGINIQPGANVTFNPGIYTLTSTSSTNGGLTVGVGTTVSGGGGVAFYNYGPYGGINFVCSSCTAGNVTLTAPTSGAFEGVLFFQDPGNTSSSVVVGSAFFNTKLTGSTYLPSAPVTFAFDITVDYNDLVAKDITFGLALYGIVATNSYNNYSALANGSPLKNSGKLVE